MAGELFRKLEGVQAIVFDAYGTLFDVATPVFKQEAALGGKAAEVAALWRQKQLEYTWVRSLIGVHADFWAVTRDALNYTLENFAITEPGLADEMMTGMLKLEAFADVAAALPTLRAKGKRLAILSNGSPSMLDSMLRAAGLEKLFEQVLSVEEVGIYKPSRRVYRLAMQKLQIADAPSICFVSANGWDAHSAAQFGFQAVRIKRAAVPDDRLPGKLAGVVENIGQLLEVV
ncbi:MAG: haloacid dehalogenase type II [Alphaproteobacteria bacterium]|nr:haloacid dehalogenase type II [Alphaproteobacteria bacterium]